MYKLNGWRRFSFRTTIWLSALCLGAGISVWAAGPAAASCGGGCYSYSYAQIIYTSPPQPSGSLMWMYNNFVHFTSSDGSHGHLNQEQWLTTPLGTYVETGITAGYNTPNLCSGYCNIPYWEDHNGSADYPHPYNAPWPASDGVQRYFLILSRGGSGCPCWDIYTSPTASISWTLQGTSTILGSTIAYKHQVGMEDHEAAPQVDYSGANLDPDENSATFDVGYETLYNGTWNLVNWTSTYVNPGCGTLGYCFNGISYGTSEWSDNKP